MPLLAILLTIGLFITAFIIALLITPIIFIALDWCSYLLIKITVKSNYLKNILLKATEYLFKSDVKESLESSQNPSSTENDRINNYKDSNNFFSSRDGIIRYFIHFKQLRQYWYWWLSCLPNWGNWDCISKFQYTSHHRFNRCTYCMVNKELSASLKKSFCSTSHAPDSSTGKNQNQPKENLTAVMALFTTVPA